MILDRHKFEDEEEIIFETDEEAIIAKNIIEEVSGYVFKRFNKS